MKPNCAQILRVIGLNIEDVILPKLTDSHAKSAAVSARGLLEQVALRLEKEGQQLFDDNKEKRQLLDSIIEKIGNSGMAQNNDLAELASKLSEGMKNAPQAEHYVSVDELTIENDALKELLEDAIITLYEHDDIDPESFEKLRQSIRKQLRAQLDREMALTMHEYFNWIY